MGTSESTHSAGPHSTDLVLLGDILLLTLKTLHGRYRLVVVLLVLVYTAHVGLAWCRLLPGEHCLEAVGQLQASSSKSSHLEA